VTMGAFLELVCPAVGCPGQNSQRPVLGWCRHSISERNWLLPLRRTAVHGCWMLHKSPGSHHQGMLCCYPVDMLVVEVTNTQTGVWEHQDGRRCESQVGRFVNVNDFIPYDVYPQPLGL